jgi:hypothetical protein
MAPQVRFIGFVELKTVQGSKVQGISQKVWLRRGDLVRWLSLFGLFDGSERAPMNFALNLNKLKRLMLSNFD